MCSLTLSIVIASCNKLSHYKLPHLESFITAVHNIHRTLISAKVVSTNIYEYTLNCNWCIQ